MREPKIFVVADGPRSKHTLMPKRPRVYLATPFGFSAHQRVHVLPLFIDALTSAGQSTGFAETAD